MRSLSRLQAPRTRCTSAGTLAHELAHILFADWAAQTGGAWDERSREEIRADAFARHLLIPLGGLKAFVGRRPVDDSALSAVVQHFLVSPQIAAIAMHQARLISDSTKASWSATSTPNLAARFGWSDQYRALQGESRQRRAPQRLLARAIAGYAEGVVSLQTIATLRRVDAETAEEELRGAGITPTDVDIEWADPGGLPRSILICRNWRRTRPAQDERSADHRCWPRSQLPLDQQGAPVD